MKLEGNIESFPNFYHVPFFCYHFSRNINVIAIPPLTTFHISQKKILLYPLYNNFSVYSFDVQAPAHKIIFICMKDINFMVYDVMRYRDSKEREF